MFSRKSKVLAVLLAVVIALSAVGTFAFANAANPADPVLTDKFVLANDCEAIPTGTVVGDFAVADAAGVKGSKAISTNFKTAAGKNVYTIDLSAAPITPGAGATEMWFNLDTQGVALVKGWVTVVNADGSYSPDDSASSPGEFYQQKADGTWSSEVYQDNDNGCFLNWTGSGYTRIKLSDLGANFDVTKPITKIMIDVKDTKYTGDPAFVYPADKKIIIDNFGFSGKDLAGTQTVDELLNGKKPVELPATMLDVQFGADGKVTDKVGSATMTINGTPTIGKLNVSHKGQKYNTTGLEISKSNGNVMGSFSSLTREQLEGALSAGFSLETFFVDKAPGAVHGVLCATQMQGFGIAVNAKKQVYGLAHDGSGYKTAVNTTEVSTTDLAHAVLTYDPTEGKLKLYVDGVLIVSNAIGSKIVAGAGEMYKLFYLGADPKDGTLVDYQMIEAIIVSAKAYTKAMTAEQVTVAYNNAVKALVPGDLPVDPPVDPPVEPTPDAPPAPNQTHKFDYLNNFEKETVALPVAGESFVAGVSDTMGFNDSNALAVALNTVSGNQNISFPMTAKAYTGATEVWMYIDTQGTNFLKIWPGLTQGGKNFTTDDKDGAENMFFYVVDGDGWVKKSFDSDGCMPSFNYKGFVRIPVEHFLNGSTPLDMTQPIEGFTCGYKPDSASSYVGKFYIFDEIAFSGTKLASGTQYVKEYLTTNKIPTTDKVIPPIDGGKEGFHVISSFEGVPKDKLLEQSDGLADGIDKIHSSGIADVKVLEGTGVGNSAGLTLKYKNYEEGLSKEVWGGLELKPPYGADKLIENDTINGGTDFYYWIDTTKYLVHKPIEQENADGDIEIVGVEPIPTLSSFSHSLIIYDTGSIAGESLSAYAPIEGSAMFIQNKTGGWDEVKNTGTKAKFPKGYKGYARIPHESFEGIWGAAGDKDHLFNGPIEVIKLNHNMGGATLDGAQVTFDNFGFLSPEFAPGIDTIFPVPVDPSVIESSSVEPTTSEPTTSEPTTSEPTTSEPGPGPNQKVIGLTQTSAKPGEEVTVTIDIPENIALCTADLHLVYDPSVLEPVSAIKTDLAKDAQFQGNLKYDTNKVALVLISLDAINGGGPLFEVKFKVKDGAVFGKTPLSLVVNDLVNYDLATIDYFASKGYVDVLDPNASSVEPSSDVPSSVEPSSVEPSSDVPSSVEPSSDTPSSVEPSSQPSVNPSTSVSNTGTGSAGVSGMASALAIAALVSAAAICFKKKK